MEWIPAKLRAIRQEFHLTQLEMAQASGLSQRDISQLENGRKEGIPKEYIQFLHSRGVDLNWLFTDPAQEAAEPTAVAGGPRQYSVAAHQYLAVVQEDQVVGYGKKAAVGAATVVREAADSGAPTLSMVGGEALLQYPKRHREPAFLRGLPTWALGLPEVQQGVCRAFQVAGADMLPTFAPLDWVIARLDNPADPIENGGAYVVVTKESVQLQRVFESPGQPDRVLLRPEAAGAAATSLLLTDVVERWSVRGHLRFTLPSAAAAPDPKVATLEAHLQDLLDRVQRLEQGQ
ncbi:helix-turn-helix domain-containing protein [Hymenobacter aquaticus]|uniref:Helix-turn-helix domain-containing protein n=1 Tax=Hymenobacter aquaticus TaxID=1867101 RepID=A0A4Z0PUS5_9BACT|nr:helix-turn-helix domain-containing protein [Hymenobacter aquaticus]TGE20643.1 helix-turn-helix domain-containing protein [Hymenobacter aquaticus]